MTLSARTFLFPAATMAALLALSACGKQDEGQTAPAGASTAPATPAPAATAPAPAAGAPAAASTTAAAVAPAAPAAAAPAAAGFKVDTVTLGSVVGNDHKVSKAKTSFAPSDKAIYASVATDGSTPGSNLSAKWTFEDGSAVSDTSKTVATDGPAVTTFKVQNPSEWPEGKYKLVVAVDGKAAATQDFEVKKK
ncbi:hypothetical protein [Pinirhizobacter soli]|uniref:hypothetical protein n=1 Tax=Pinirhizobacter soli TaxID=2786953 RepID=UPI00202A1536|nr:hypothetical protein [Pinirhizobacter soli]